VVLLEPAKAPVQRRSGAAAQQRSSADAQPLKNWISASCIRA